MPAPLTNHLHKHVPEDYVDVGTADVGTKIESAEVKPAEMHLSDRYVELEKIQPTQNTEPEQQPPRANVPIQKVPTQAVPEVSPQQCMASLRRTLLDARLMLLEYSSGLVTSYSKEQTHKGQGRRLQGHVYMARVRRLEQQLDYLERLQGAAKHVSRGPLGRQPDDGIFEVCEQALENALYLLEYLPKPSYMVDLNEVVWQSLAGMVTTKCVETGVTMTLPIILGNPQILTWLMTELLVGSALTCLQAAKACEQESCKHNSCKHGAKPLLAVDYLDTTTNWRLHVSVSNAMCAPSSEDRGLQTRFELDYVKHAVALLEGDFWVEAVSHEETTFSLTLPKRMSSI